jgi:uncharacterized protein YceH (UPF0502 family)
MLRLIPKRLQALIWVALTVAWLLMAWQTTASAQIDSRVESRLTQLEFELRDMRSRLSQIESRRPTLGPSVRPQNSAPIAPPADANNPSLEARLVNLANLAIETKQDVQALEQRVTRLEAQTP